MTDPIYDFLASAKNILANAPKLDLINVQATVLELLIRHLDETGSEDVRQGLVLIDHALGRARK